MSMKSLSFAAALVAGLSVSAQAQVRLDVPYVPTPQSTVDRMLEMAKVTADDYVIDLGSGDGRIAVTAAQKYGARAFGVDINPERIREANENAKQAGVTDKVTFREQDLFKTEIAEATVLTMYLLQSVNLRLRPRILAELRPGTRVVSHAFDMGEWEPDQQDTSFGRVHMWIVPAQVQGRWNVEDGEGGSLTIELEQEYQRIKGRATIDGRSVALQAPTLRGADISFVIEHDDAKRLFRGRVDGDRMEAVPAEAVQPVEKWRASRAS